MSFPTFRYHPDPIATGSVKRSEISYKACDRARGLIYACLVYGGEDDYVEAICPWCIADGTAHERLGVEFTDPLGIGGYGQWEPVPAAVVEEVNFRTPGFNGWQAERWFTHCGDAAEFLGIVGKTELDALGAEAIAAIQEESGYKKEEWNSYFQSLDRDRGPTAYLFRCWHCRKWGGYSDCH